MAGPNAQTVTLAFRDPAREAAFLDYFAREARPFYRVGMALSLLMWSASAGFDLAAPADVRGDLLTLRFAVVAPVIALALVIGFLPWRWYRRLAQPAGLTVYLTVLLGVAALVALSPGQLGLLVIGGFLVVVLTGAAFDLARAVHVVGCAVIGTVVMVVVILRASSLDAQAAAVQCLWIGLALVAAGLVSVRFEQARRRRFLDGEALATEQRRTEALLANLLPASIAARLREGPIVIADAVPAVSVLFADLVGFTKLSASIPATELVARLDRVFSAFDDLASRHGLEKIKTIGDAYMVVAGAPFERVDHALACVRIGLEMIETLAAIEPELQLRVGVASGPVVAGVIGRSKSSYDLWGATVNLASRLESHGQPGRVHISSETQALLGAAVACEPRRTVELKGVGPVESYLVIERTRA